MTDAYTTSIRIDASPAEVFPYLVDADLIVRWMGDWAELDATPGGKLVLDINGVPIRGEYVVVEPPHRVVFTWGAAGSGTLPPGSTPSRSSCAPRETGRCSSWPTATSQPRKHPGTTPAGRTSSPASPSPAPAVIPAPTPGLAQWSPAADGG